MLLPILQFFAATGDCTKHTFFGLVPWYQYLNLQPVEVRDSHQVLISTACRVQDFNNSSEFVLGVHSPVLLIGLAVLEDLIRIAALVAVGYIIYGGFQYITSQGAPDATKRAQQTIINALVGVAIAIVAASGVAFMGHRLGS